MQRKTTAPCSNCAAKTTHIVLHEEIRATEYSNDAYVMLECGGCGRVSMAHQQQSLYDGDVETQYYPLPVSRKPPEWTKEKLWVLEIGDLGTIGGKHRLIGGLFHEIYEALHGGQVRLAAMGVRAFLEQLMISKVGDHKSFQKNLDAFHKDGYISLVQRDAMNDILDAGHAVIHRFHKPSEADLNTALNIAEGIFAAINVHGDAASKVADRTPKRQRAPKPKKGSS